MNFLSFRRSVGVARSLRPRWIWEGSTCFKSNASLSNTFRRSILAYSGGDSSRRMILC